MNYGFNPNMNNKDMLPDKTDRALLTLVRSAIYESPEVAAAFPGLSDTEWESVYSRSKLQTVSGVAFSGLSYLREEAMPPEPLIMRWLARCHCIERQYSDHCLALRSLLELFRREGMEPTLQKGLDVARFYPDPRVRVCGDIDLYFPEREKEGADDVVRKSGVAVENKADGSSCYVWEGIVVEHHNRLVELHGKERLVRSLVEGGGDTETEISEGLRVKVAPPSADLIMVSVHIMKHCFGVGTGLRHFCDYAMAARRLLPEIGEENYRRECRRLGVARWTEALDAFVSLYLAPAGERKSEADISRGNARAAGELLKMVMQGGNFGRGDEPSGGGHSKGNTLMSFMRHLPLSLRLAPGEALRTMAGLMAGQIGL